MIEETDERSEKPANEDDGDDDEEVERGRVRGRRKARYLGK